MRAGAGQPRGTAVAGPFRPPLADASRARAIRGCSDGFRPTTVQARGQQGTAGPMLCQPTGHMPTCCRAALNELPHWGRIAAAVECAHRSAATCGRCRRGWTATCVQTVSKGHDALARSSLPYLLDAGHGNLQHEGHWPEQEEGEDGKDESSKEVASRHIDKRDEDHV